MRERKIAEIVSPVCESRRRILLITAAVHGDEPGAVSAVERVFSRLEGKVRGTCVAFIGNRRALQRRRFCIETNLNRLWTPERMSVLESGNELPHEFLEDREQQELYQAMAPYLDGEVTFLDIYGTGSKTGPFVFSDSAVSEQLASRLEVPNVLGLGANSAGELYQYVSSLGHVSIRVIAGTQGTPKTIRSAEALIWNTLVEQDFTDEPEDYSAFIATLREARGALPKTLHILYRHRISPVDGFHMAPGLTNFQEIGRGDVVAFDKYGAIRAPKSGLLFLPSYRLPSDFGFHIVGNHAPLSSTEAPERACWGEVRASEG